MRKIAFLCAIIMSAISLGMLYQYQSEFEERVSGGEPIPVLVASQPISLGEIVTREMLAIRDIPESYIEARHIRATEASKVVGIRATMALHGDEAMLWTDLAVSSNEARILSGLVKPGMRAATIKMDQKNSLSKMLRPGDRIDILFRSSLSQGNTIMPLLQNIMVLAVGQDLGRSKLGGENIFAQVMGGSDLTLSVTTAQAQVLTLAQGEGSLSASLRHPDDIIIDSNSPVIGTDSIHIAEKRASLQTYSSKHRKAKAASKKQEIEHVR